MKQVFIRKGKVIIEETPLPMCDVNSALIRVTHSVISVGTEMKSVERSQQDSLVQRVIAKPTKLLKIGDIIKKNGLVGAVHTIQNMQKKLDQIPAVESGYSCSGIVVKVDENIADLKSGDRVACGGVGKAVHAEVVSVPRNLLVKIPEGVSLKDASSATIGSIAMQGVRRADVRVGEYVAVIGLGLIGQITVQLLNAAGCRVFGIDLVDGKLNLAVENGMYHSINANDLDPVQEVMTRTDNMGVDACIIAAASSGDEIVQQAMEMTRKKGTVVVVGAVGLGLNRQPFYKKEIDFRISCSYGPGRYDEIYEEKGIDYPYAYVRWTENRNMEEYLRLIGEGKMNFTSLISEEQPVEAAPQIYESLKAPDNERLGVVLTYNFDPSWVETAEKRTVDRVVKAKAVNGKIRVGLIGAGGFAKGMHLPNLKALNDLYRIRAIAGRNGANAKETANLFDADYATTDYQQILNDPNVDMVLITTRHNTHAAMAAEAARAGKAVFLEKPMGLNVEELAMLEEVLKETGVPFTVGFNRRFSPFAKKTKEIIGEWHNPTMALYRVNARKLPNDHWVHGPEGGGRIVGEACHMIDFFSFIAGAPLISLDISGLSPKTSSARSDDNIAAVLKYENGAVCTLIYTTCGSDAFGKEYIEVAVDEKTIVIDNFLSMQVHGMKRQDISDQKPDKGHLQLLKEFAAVVRNRCDASPISIDSLVETTKTSYSMRECIGSMN